MSAGDIHIWKPGTTPLEAECGYVQVVETLLDAEGEETEHEVVVPAEPTGESCADCTAAVAPAPEEGEGE